MSEDKYKMNRLNTAKNPHQGKFKKVLCVCSAGLLRSPTAAFVLSQEPFNFNTRAAGLTPQFALVPVDEVLLEWADEIVCMEPEQAHAIRQRVDKNVLCLGIPDVYGYRNPTLIEMIKTQYSKLLAELDT